jgi:hypothetical protein
LRLVTDAVCETAHVESYNNVIVITVAGDNLMGVRRRIPPSEMHVFYCLHLPGQDLVDDIMTAKAGKPLRKHDNSAGSVQSTDPIYSQPRRPPPIKMKTPPNSVNSLDNSASSVKHAAASTEQELSEFDKKTIDLKVLDLCFGEIEQFVAHLQNAAKQHNTNDAVQVPSAKEFFDIFQKTKLSFILLARLKQEIQNPSASELVNALFAPFRLVVDASRDPVTNKAQLASQIITPLLTSDAVKLLDNCLSSADAELLRLLGTAWTTPRNSWIEAIPKFLPHFGEGYVPPTVWLNDVLSDQIPNNTPADWLMQSSHGSAFSAMAGDTSSQLSESFNYDYPEVQREQPRSNEDIKRKLAREYAHRQELELRRAQQRDRMLHNQDLSPRDMSRDSSSVDMTTLDVSTIDRQQHDFLQNLRGRNAKVCIVSRGRVSGNAQELTLENGEIVELLDDSRNWWKLQNNRSETGYAPSNILHRI